MAIAFTACHTTTVMRGKGMLVMTSADLPTELALAVCAEFSINPEDVELEVKFDFDVRRTTGQPEYNWRVSETVKQDGYEISFELKDKLRSDIIKAIYAYEIKPPEEG